MGARMAAAKPELDPIQATVNEINTRVSKSKRTRPLFIHIYPVHRLSEDGPEFFIVSRTLWRFFTRLCIFYFHQ